MYEQEDEDVSRNISCLGFQVFCIPYYASVLVRSCFTTLINFSHSLASFDIVCDGYLYNHHPGACVSLRIHKNGKVVKCVN